MARVLICDDYKAIRDIVRKTCETAGYETIEASTGKEAIELYKSTGADLVFLDVLIPEMDGIEVMETLKKIDPAVRVIAMSGAAMGGTYLELIRRRGAIKCLTKPFSIDDLLAAIREVLSPPES